MRPVAPKERYYQRFALTGSMQSTPTGLAARWYIVMIKNDFNPKTNERRNPRMRYYNYSTGGFYFVTICAYDKKYLFGNVVDDKMICNAYGEIARDLWYETSVLRPGVMLHEFVVMPNHIHGIIELKGGDNALSAIIRGYKSSVSGKLKPLGIGKVWQRNYYEHLIRNEDSYLKISDYISNNPRMWAEDEYRSQPLQYTGTTPIMSRKPNS